MIETIVQQSPLFAGLLTALFAAVAFWKSEGDPARRLFGFLCLSLLAWNLGYYLESTLAITDPARLLLSKLSHAGGILAVALGFHFMLRFTGEARPFFRRFLGLTYLLSALLLLFLFTPWLIAGIRAYSFGYHAVWGPLYFLYPANMVAAYLLMVLMLVRKYRVTESNVERNRTGYMLIGTLIVALTTLTNFLPALGHGIRALGYLGISCFMVILLIAAWRFRLMNIRLALAKALLYLLYGLFLFLILLLLQAMTSRLSGEAPSSHARFLSNLLVVLLFMTAFQLSRRHVLPLIERRIYPLRSDLRTLFTSLDRAALEAEGPADILRAFTEAMAGALNVPYACAFLMEENRTRMVRIFEWGDPKPGRPDQLGPEHRLFGMLGPLVREELREDARLEISTARPVTESRDLALEMEALSVEILIPLVARDRTIGLFGFGKKRFRGVYDRSDIDALQLLARHAAEIAARLQAVSALKEREHLARVGEMTAMIAHELKNPIGVLGGAIQGLPANDRNTGILREETARLDRIVRQFLLFARPAEVAAAPTDMGRLVRRCCELFREEISAGRFTLLEFLPNEPVLTVTDPDLFKQIFFNLAKNSLEARPDGELRITLSRAGRSVRLEFTDNGGGLTDKASANLFKPFMTTKIHGTGLGLPIVRKLVESLGGGIEIKNNPGSGLRISLNLPGQPPDASAKEPACHPPS